MSSDEKPGRQWLGYVLKYVVPLVITVGLCWLLLTGVDLKQMWHIIVTECDFRWIAAAMCVSVLSHVVRAARWQIQLRGLGIRPGLWALTLSIFGTYAVNLVFPRLGEVWRTGWISKRENAPFATVFGSMVSDRLMDTITVALLTVLAFLVAGPQMSAYLQGSGSEGLERLGAVLASPWLWVAVAVIAAACGLLMWKLRHTAAMRKTIELVKGLWEGFAVIVKMPGKWVWLLLVVATFGCYFLQFYLTMFAFPLTTEVVAEYGISAVLVCFVLSSLSMGVPSNGGIGPWQWAVIFGLSLYPIAGLDRAYASTFANTVMGTQTLLLIALGIFTFACIAFTQKKQSK